MTTHPTIPTARTIDTLRIVTDVLLPNVAKGPIIRRPRMVALAERLKLDARSVRRMQKLRRTYGSGPVRLRIPVWSRAVILEPEHVHRVLADTPEPFATASDEKRAALAHFEPKNALISHGPKRADRRRFNEQVLDAHTPVHRLASRFVEVVQAEAHAMLDGVARTGELTWDVFAPTWFRIVRRVIFGDQARDDDELTDLLAQLRADANWAFLKPRRKAERARFLSGVQDRLGQAEPGSLSSIIAGMTTTSDTAPEHQVAQWLFAFDPAGMTTFRALALLATHPDHAAHARQEIATDTTQRQHLLYLRACVLESLRLWPTTPLLLRQSTVETTWETGTIPAKTGILIYAPYFHRDDQSLPDADRFAPELWLAERPGEAWAFVPFSGGPGVCPGQELVLLLSSAMLAVLLDGQDVRLTSRHRLDPSQPLPGTLNNYSLRFAIVSDGRRTGEDGTDGAE